MRLAMAHSSQLAIFKASLSHRYTSPAFCLLQVAIATHWLSLGKLTHIPVFWQALHSTNTIQYERHDLSDAEQEQLRAAASDPG